MKRDVSTIELDDTHCVVSWKNALVSKWRNGAPNDQLVRLAAALGTMAEKQPGGVVTVIWLVENLPIPEAEGRDIVTQMMKTQDKSLLGWVMIIEGQGFRASAARTVAQTVRLMSRASFPWKISASVGEAIPWIAERMSLGPQMVTPNDVRAVMSTVTDTLAAATARSEG